MAEVTQEQVPPQIRDMFNKGFVALERENLDYAIDLLFQCVVEAPAFLQARKFLRAAEIQKFKRKKINPLTHIISTIKGVPKLAKMKAGKDDASVLVAAESLLRGDPLNVKFIKVFAQAAVNSALPEAAVQTLEVARDHYPNNISIINWLGALYQKMGRTKAARECFEKLSEICPNDPEALKSLKDAIALDSMSSDGWQEAADQGGSYRDIIKDSEEAVLLEQEAKAVKSDRDAMALIEDCLQKIENDPENINYYRTAAKLYAQVKKFDESIDVMGKAMEISSGDPELEYTMSSIQVQKYNYEIKSLREFGDEAGMEAKQAEMNQFVFTNLQERVKRYPNDVKLRYEWGIMLIENDYFNEAIQQFQISQRSPTFRVKSLYYLAMCFKAKKQYDLATEQFEQASEEIFSMDDTKKDIYYQIGQIAETVGDNQKAAEYFKRIYQVDIGYKDIAQKVEKVYNKEAE